MYRTLINNLTLGTALRFLCIGTLSMLVFWYVHFQARNFLSGPVITLSTPDTPLQTEQIITLSGEAHNIVKLTLNGNEIHTTEDGLFAQDLVLEKGYSIATLVAHDRFGRTETVTRTYVYLPHTPEKVSVVE